MKQIDYYFSLLSPYAYLGHESFQKIAKRHQLKVNHRPINLAKIFPRSGGLALKDRAKQRQDYRFLELKRWAAFRKLPLQLQPKYFPTSEDLASRLVVVLKKENLSPELFIGKVLQAVWAQDKDISQEATLQAILQDIQADPAACLEQAQTEEITKAVEQETEDAYEKSIFGSPSWIYNGELFWGQDRLDFLERAIEANN